MNIDFSLIIPVYNAESTLDRCLNSVLDQTYKNFEVILIDDGSKDHSFELCKKYEDMDCRVHVFHKDNGGPSSARNLGLTNAVGEFICFIDCDDSVEKNYLQSLVKIKNNEQPDIIFMGYNLVNIVKNEKSIHVADLKECDKYPMLLELSKQDMFGYTWIKAIRRDTIADLRFDERINLFEDEIFTCNVLKNCKNISILKEPIYNYYIANMNALTQKVHTDYCQKSDYVFQAWEKLLDTYPDYEKEILAIADKYVERCIYYGLERDVPIKAFFQALSITTFYQKHTRIFELDKYIKSNQYFMLKLKKSIYILKDYFYKKLKRGESR